MGPLSSGLWRRGAPDGGVKACPLGLGRALTEVPGPGLSGARRPFYQILQIHDDESGRGVSCKALGKDADYAVVCAVEPPCTGGSFGW